MTYIPQPLPINADPWVRRELEAISEAFARSFPFLYVDNLAVAIDRPRDGMIVMSDGTATDFGPDAGVYAYWDSEWHYLGAYPSVLPVVTVVASKTIGAAEYGKWVEVDSGSGVTLTLPDVNMDGAYGKSLIVRQKNTGQVTFTAASGATVECAGTAKTRARYSACGLQLVADGVWAVTGDYA